MTDRIKLAALAKEHGTKNLRFMVPIQFFCHGAKIDFSVECVIDERRYKAQEGYKIGLTTKQKFARGSIFGGLDLVNLYFDTYQSDLEGMMERKSFADFTVEVVENGGVIPETTYNTEYMITGFHEPKKLKPDDVKALEAYIVALNTKVA
jgi:hypothetical protein